jgi:hypothetical protein
MKVTYEMWAPTKVEVEVSYNEEEDGLEYSSIVRSEIQPSLDKDAVFDVLPDDLYFEVYEKLKKEAGCFVSDEDIKEEVSKISRNRMVSWYLAFYVSRCF